MYGPGPVIMQSSEILAERRLSPFIFRRVFAKPIQITEGPRDNVHLQYENVPNKMRKDGL